MIVDPSNMQDYEIANTLGLPCVANRVLHARSLSDVLHAAQQAAADGQDLLILGEGSNVVLPPRLKAPVLYIEDRSLVIIREDEGVSTLRVGAGLAWHELVVRSLAMQLYGLENLALIPGLVGAAPVQNIGAYGRELSEFVVAVHGVDLKDQQLRVLSAPDCAFAYRDSIFKRTLRDRFVITALDLQLSRRPNVRIDYPSLAACFESSSTAPTPDAVCAAVIGLRKARLHDPSEVPNVGSFFKNPVISATHLQRLREEYPGMPAYGQPEGRYKVPAAWMIDHCQLRGFSVNGAAVSTRHALVLINAGEATQADIQAVAEHVAQCVESRFSVTLEPEPRMYDA